MKSHAPPARGEDDLRPCLAYSAALHLGAAAAAVFLLRGAALKSTPVFMIDFVGPSAAIISSRPESDAGKKGPSAYALKPQAEINEFAAPRRRKGAPLPRPSLLRGWRDTPAPQEKPAPASAAAEAPASGPPGQAGVATDLPNFPYPWYISQLRQSLWNQWATRMPKDKGECVVAFALLPSGKMVDLRTEESSGDPAFDLAALSAVQDAAPFPPLPRGFSERFLKIHVTLQTL